MTTLAPDAAIAPSLGAIFRPRRGSERRIAGVASGWADQLGVSPLMVRAALLALTAAGGVGGVVYLIGWAVVVDGDRPHAVRSAPATARQKVGLLCVLGGVLLAMRAVGIWFGDAVAIPAALLIMGIASVWDRDQGLLGWGAGGTRPKVAQVVVGVVLMVGGVVLFAQLGPERIRDAAGIVAAIVVVLAGVGLVFGRWAHRLATDLTDERYERIRQAERADVAAHLHDSVLQTLALIQRTDDPRRMVTLARRQERELRDWLYLPDSEPTDSLTGALRRAADRVEDAHDVPVEVVAVGDADLDDGLRALVGAAGEAMTNAAKHAGVERVAVYAEVLDGRAEVFVTDLGVGFDPASVAADRRGISDSIVGRMRRHGGEARLSSEPGEGTEVALTMPVMGGHGP